MSIVSDSVPPHPSSGWTGKPADAIFEAEMIAVFTDLDGSLLDADTYSWEEARPALDLLASRGIPWVMVSSKTRAEIECLRSEMGHSHPFVAENGAAAVIPQGYFGSAAENATVRDGYEVLEWGKPYEELVAALRTLAAGARCPVSGFSGMSIQDVCAATALSPAQAALAKQREYDEPFLAPDKPRIPHLLTAIERAGLRWTHGGRFYHLCGNNDKAVAVAALCRLFARRYGALRSIGLGDSLNDLPLLKAVDIPVLIRSSRPPSIYFRTLGARYTRSAGPKGWNEAVTELLAEMPAAQR